MYMVLAIVFNEKLNLFATASPASLGLSEFRSMRLPTMGSKPISKET